MKSIRDIGYYYYAYNLDYYVSFEFLETCNLSKRNEALDRSSHDIQDYLEEILL